MSLQDMDILLTEAINTASHFLEKRGEFFPFAVVRTDQNEVRHIQALAEDSRPASEAVLEWLRTSLREGGASGKYKAVAMVSNVQLANRNTGEKSDAISIEIDDCEDGPVLCYMPYRLDSGVLTLDKISAGTGAKLAFF